MHCATKQLFRNSPLSYNNAISMNSNLENCFFDTATDSCKVEGGVTGLGDHSNQRFKTTKRINNIDTINITTLYVRLVADKSDKYISLKPKGNIYPKRTNILPNNNINGVNESCYDNYYENTFY